MGVGLAVLGAAARLSANRLGALHQRWSGSRLAHDLEFYSEAYADLACFVLGFGLVLILLAWDSVGRQESRRHARDGG